jgi:xanthine dehydrogenase small subunit
MLRFLLNNKLINLSPKQADLTVLDYLRDEQQLTGTKEGCASGDCGACTVVLAEPINNAEGEPTLHYRSINSCITFMSALQGKQLITIEHLPENGVLHPVQQSLVDHHGSQCGFCTPGFIMSMFALYHQNEAANTPIERDTVYHALSGNLCRCTGYRPIIEATLHACANKQADHFDATEATVSRQLRDLSTPSSGEKDQAESPISMPKNRLELAQSLVRFPQAAMFAGSTDLALQVTQQLKQFSHLISLSQVVELNQLAVRDKGLWIGAALPLSDIEATLLRHFPSLEELITRFASRPIRNQATLGGNVANASPIGDLPPVLLALNAKVHVDNGTSRRVIDACEFFIDYRKTQLQAGEWIEALFLPFIEAPKQLRAYKISKRLEDDISAVCAVFNLTIEHDVVVSAYCGFGGVAATPASLELDRHLRGKPWSAVTTYELGAQLIAEAFSPIDDVRASKAYRQQMLVNLWRRYWLETSRQQNNIATRIVNLPTHADHVEV